MQGFGVSLAKNYTNAVSATRGPFYWPGGRGQLVITATTYPTTTKLQLLANGGVTIDYVTVVGNGAYAADFPAGQYQLSMSGEAVAAMYADLVSVRYG